MVASAALFAVVAETDFYIGASRVAFYQAFDGEIDPLALLHHSISQGKKCFLPLVRPHSELLSFVPYDSTTVLIENHWGILQPSLSTGAIAPHLFDLVFVPVVGFDVHGFRLGMGKGFYDRAFSFKRDNPASRPLLVGLAHECQLLAPLAAEPWDVRLDAVVTPDKLYHPGMPPTTHCNQHQA